MKIKQNAKIILASTSKWRKAVFEDVNLQFTSMAPLDEEDDYKEGVKNLPIPEQALKLGTIKGLALSKKHPEAYIVCGDQIGEVNGERSFKPLTREKAIEVITNQSGKTNKLHSSVILYKNGEVLWSHVDTTEIGIRNLSAEEIETYVDSDPGLLHIAGGVKIEGIGKHFVSHMKGDYYSILGMPVYPLLAELYKRGILEVTA